MIESTDDTPLLRRAVGHHNAGRLKDAEAIYRQILTRNPNQPDALHLLGVLARQCQKTEIAAALVKQAIAVKPGMPTFHQSLGEIYQQMGQFEQARLEFQRALQLNPAMAIVLDRMGNLERETGHADLALGFFTQFSKLQPDAPEGHYNVGVCLKELGRAEEAVAAYRQAIQLYPDFPEALNNLGVCLKDLGRPDEAIEEYERAAHLRPDFVEVHNNLGAALMAVGSIDHAITKFRKAIELKADFGGAHYNLGMALLMRGDFTDGWREYDWRWRAKGFTSPRYQFDRPQWDGSDPTGKTILLHGEQGFGDSVQFIRYASLVAGRGAKVLVWTPPELQRLFQNVEGVSASIAQGECPPFDLHCPLMSLAGIFDTRVESIPASVPYLRADATLVEQWEKKISLRSGAKRIGLAWAGRPTHGDDLQRSIPLAQFAGITDLARFEFFSLQKGDAGAQAANPPAGMNLVDLTGDLKDFADTAALIANLDLVIAVDSAVVHLAGAMGKPVWVLLPQVPDWRWMLDREDSPWYPTMRLFRQPRRGDWKTPLARIDQSLREL